LLSYGLLKTRPLLFLLVILRLIGGLTDSLQSLVLPPLLYLAESRRRTLRPFNANPLANYSAITSGTRDGTRDGTGGGTGGSGGFVTRRRVELALCGALAAFGLCFIVFATRSNLAAIATFLNSPQETGQTTPSK
jgi:hypothetical protein